MTRLLRVALLLVAVTWPSLGLAGVEKTPTGWAWVAGDEEQAWAVTGLYGTGSANNLSGTLENLFSFDGTDNRMALGAIERRIARYRNLFAIEGEAMYAYHFGDQTYNEVGVAAYVRWLDFPWNDEVVTTFAVGTGPSWTSIYPDLEKQSDPDDKSQWLNQFNLELTAGLEDIPSTILVLRLQHRSGVFGAMGGVRDGSNFMTAGLRHFF